MNISFSLTTDQVRRGFQTGVIEKDVTRRMGWENLKAGAVLKACRKCMGLKRGEKPEVLGLIQVVSVTRESLLDICEYPKDEVKREGFPSMTAREFVDFFCSSHKGCISTSTITRIEFAYLLPFCIEYEIPPLRAIYKEEGFALNVATAAAAFAINKRLGRVRKIIMPYNPLAV